MKHTRIIVAAATAFVMLIGGANLALADDLVADGDALTAGSSSNGENTSVRDGRCDSDFVGSGSAVASYSGGSGGGAKHLKSGSSVSVTSTPSAAATAAGISVGGGGSATVPGTWQSGSSLTVAISVTVPTTVLDGTYGIDVEAAGVDQNGDALTLKDKYNVIVDCGRTADEADTTPPSISYSFSGTAGNGDWYTTGGTLSWTVADDESSVSSSTGCDDVTITDDTNGTEYTCSATSEGGTVSVTATIMIDSIPPTASPSLSEVDYNGWYNSPVTVTWDWSDSGSGTDACSETSTYDGDDSATASTSASCSDVAGNSSGSVSSGTFQYDATAPTTTVTGVTEGSSYALGSFILGCESTDNLSGIEIEATPGSTGGNSNGVGSRTTTCTGAKDNAGNAADDSAPVNYTTTYMPSDPSLWSGILQPINSDNTSLFSRGKTVPVKWKMSGDEPAGFSVTGWKVERKEVACSGSFDSSNSTSEVGSTSSAGLRYDSGADQYVYNADFRTTNVGTCWRVRGVFDNGETTRWSGAFKITK